MLNSLPWYMLQCLLITIIAECTLASIFKFKLKDSFVILLVNVLTNPLLVSITFSVGIFFGNTYLGVTTFILELLVLVIEGFIYKKVLINKKINPYLLSLILNLTSYLTGGLINYIFY